VSTANTIKPAAAAPLTAGGCQRKASTLPSLLARSEIH
jgi:hypothetical protein